MKLEIAEGAAMTELDVLSRSIGNIPFFPGSSLASVMRDNGKIIGFTSVQTALHAAGSWVHPDYRGKRHTYQLRALLEDDLRLKGFPVYFSLPGNEFERVLFKKYGPVKEQIVQIKEL